MASDTKYTRRRFLGAAAAGIAATDRALMGITRTSFGQTMGIAPGLTPIEQIRAGVLDVGYYEAGPGNGAPVLLLHGFPYSLDSYVDVAPLLVARGCRVVVPYCGATGRRASSTAGRRAPASRARSTST